MLVAGEDGRRGVRLAFAAKPSPKAGEGAARHICLAAHMQAPGARRKIRSATRECKMSTS